MSPLTVYRASAGSGKTFALTLEYLVLLFRSPDAYRHILAVTFTNKAAGEMKDRILDLLFKLSQPDAKDLGEELEQLVKRTGLKERVLRMQAGDLLDIILNDYSGFSVGTIDRFFQSVIRAFTREIGIQPGYNLELDHQRVLALGVDLLFRDIGDHLELQQWLIRFAEDRMEESRSWNFRNDIIRLGMQLFRESFQELFSDHDLSMLEKENLDNYLEDLRQVEGHALKEMAIKGKKAMDRMAERGYRVEDFRLKGKSPATLFRQAAEGEEVRFTDTRLEALEQQEKWLNKDAPDDMAHLTVNELMPLLKSIYGLQVSLNTIQAIRQNYYTLGILGDIRDRVHVYLKEHNLFLITDSSRFLRGITGGNQVPFIYEKTGNRYYHIMLDEFQDTSVFQYDNFRPLLDNALASGNDNLVVGDVKQSIYRWRNSDWKILATDLESDFTHQEFITRSLDQNFRSRDRIIRFNNSVFQLAPEVLARMIESELCTSPLNRAEAEEAVEQFRNAYSDAIQKVPERSDGSGGLVKMELFRQEEDISFHDQVLSRIPAWLDEIQQSGIEPGEIAVLVRTRKEGVMVAEKLLEHARITGESQRYRLISSESLMLAHNGSVTLLISAFRYLVHPEDHLNNALLKYRYFRVSGREAGDKEGLFDVSVSPSQYLFPEFDQRIQKYRQLALFELVEALIGLFELDRRVEDLPYLQAFQDLVIEAQRKESMGIAEFLLYWEQQGSGKGIQVSENSNAVRILTIHRAKGLEFRAVLLPFCNWELTTDQRKSNILWCSTEGTPFNRIPNIPVRFSSHMKHTLFSGAYYQERMKGYLDNLNLMYVAFTRARDALFLGVPQTGGESCRNTGDLLNAILDMEPDREPALEPLALYREGDVVTIGRMPAIEKKPAEEDPWRFIAYSIHQGDRMLKCRMRSDEYFVDEEGIFSTGREFGNMMHLVFSRISVSADVDHVLTALQKEGVLPRPDRVDLQGKIMEMLSGPEVRDWFTGREGRIVYNERNIFCGNGRVVRPDRVIVDRDGITVVDFKFGQVEKEDHRVQVRYYMEQLRAMGYQAVKGFLWYAMIGKTIQIGQS